MHNHLTDDRGRYRLLEYKPLHVLNIPDEYQYMQPELIEELEAMVWPYLQ